MKISDIKHRLIPYRINKKNNIYDRPLVSLPSFPIYLFYHIYCGPNDWKGIFYEQIELMIKSNLIKKISRIYLTIIGFENDKKFIISQIPHDKINIVYFSSDGSCFEFPCLSEMKRISQNENFYALYIHTKGSSYSRFQYNNKYGKFETLWLNTISWRNIMNYFNITKWNMAVNALANGYDTYGCIKMSPHSTIQKYHYSGNFWWSTSENIKKCSEIDTQYINNRWLAELWIINDGSKAYYPFYSYLLLYEAYISSSTYLKPWYHRENIKYALYYFFKARKHLLY